MKISKSTLKQMIKECLVEILVEGLDSSSATRLAEATIPRITQPIRQQPTQHAPIQHVRQNVAIQSAIKNAAAGNSILESVLADTAATTMQAQISAEPQQILRSLIDDESADTNPSAPIQQTSRQRSWEDLAFNTPRPSAEKLLTGV